MFEGRKNIPKELALAKYAQINQPSFWTISSRAPHCLRYLQFVLCWFRSYVYVMYAYVRVSAACVRRAYTSQHLKGRFCLRIASFGCSAERQRETYLVLLCSVCTSTVSYPTYRFEKVFLHLNTRASFGVTTVRTFRAETSSLLKLRSFAPWFTLFSDWYLERWLKRGIQSVHLRWHFLLLLWKWKNVSLFSTWWHFLDAKLYENASILSQSCWRSSYIVVILSLEHWNY